MAFENEGTKKLVWWITFGLTVIAWIFSVVTVGHCSFIDVNGQGIGLFNFEDGSGCERYDDPDFDSEFETARAFGVMATLAMSFALALVIALLFLNKLQQPLWLAVRVLFGISLFCQLITFVAFADDRCDVFDCDLGAAGGVAVTNVLFTIALIALTCLLPAPEEAVIASANCCGGDEETGAPREVKEQPAAVSQAGETTKITIKEGPNGEKTTIKEVTHADGSKTITETVEVEQ